MSTPATTSWASSRPARRLRALLAVAVIVLLPVASGCVQQPTQAVDDATLMVQVKTALLNDPSIGLMPIEVNVTQSVVSLSGRVPSEEDAERAVGIARGVTGVREVKSSLQIAPGGRGLEE